MKRFSLTLLVWLVVILAIQPKLTAQVNDPCSGAIAVTCGQTVTGSTSAANNDGPATDCNGGSTAPDVWYTITGTGGSITASLCGSTYDTQLDVYTGACGALVNIGGCNDDFCGTQSEMTWASTLGVTYFIRVHGFAGSTGNFSLAVTCAAAFNPCAAPIETIACGGSKSVNLTGGGAGWSPGSCGFSTAGAEKVYSFTPTVTGIHTLQVTATNGTFIDYFFKDAAGGCSSTGWICIDDISTVSSVTFGPLTAGTTYLILLDDESTASSTATFQINCPAPPVDPCVAPIETITCGSSKTVNLSGSGGGWSPNNCGFFTPGAEKVYSFTPTVTGTHTLQVTAADGTFIDYFFKDASGGCSSTGWTCIDDISSVTSVNFGPLTAGTTYLILLDDESTTSSTATFQINCPTSVVQMNCPGPITVNAPSGATNMPVSWPAITATTNCGIGSTTIVQTAGPVSGASFPIGTTTVSFLATDGCASTATCSFTVTVVSCPSITNPSTVAPLCAGGSIPNLSASTNATGANAISWVRFNTAQTTPNMYTGGTLLGSSTPAAGVATFTPTAANFPVVGNTTTNYFVYAILNPTPTDPACRPFVEIPITVNPTPTVNAVGNQNLCNGQLTSAITFTGAVPVTTYNWTNSNTSIGLAASGTGNIPAFAAINTSFATVQTATITVTPVFMGCAGTPTNFTITVQPTPQPQLTPAITIVSTAPAACPSLMHDVVLDIQVQNTGNIPLTSIQLREGFAVLHGAVFVGLVSPPVITASTATTTPTLNPLYNANSNTNLFTQVSATNIAGNSGLLAPGQFVTVRLSIRVNPNANCGNPVSLQVTALGSGNACGSILPAGGVSVGTPLTVPALMSSLEMANFACADNQCANGQTVVAFTAKVKNTGNVPVSNVQVTNNLASEMGAAFINVIPGTLRYAFEISNAASGPTVNAAFTGAGGSTQLFNNGALLNPCDSIVVVFKALVNPAAGGANLANQFTATGMYSGSMLSDVSDSGPAPESNNIGASGDTGCSDDATVLCLPVIITPPQDITVNACDSWPADIQAWLNNNAGVVFDNTCNTLTCVLNSYLTGNPWVPTSNCGLNQTLLVNFTAQFTDVNGRMSELCFCANITVVDDTPPFFDMLPMDKTIDCTSANAASQVQMWLDMDGGAWVHACSGDVLVTNNYNGTLPTCNTPRTVVFTATDECGRRSTASATLTINDNTAPVISGVPANASVSCIAQFPPAANVTSTDACGTPTMTMTERLENITSRLSGSQEVPARATSATGTFTASVSETGLMTLTVNFSGLTTPVTAAHLHTGAFGSNGPVAVDLIPAVIQAGVTSGNFTGTVQLTAAQIQSLKEGNLYINIHTSTYPGGEIRGQLGGCARLVRTWTATDACANTATASQTVTVNDAIAPTITNVPADITLSCPATSSFATPTPADNCDAVAMTFTDVTTGTPCPGTSTTTRTWTVTDMCGNTTTATSRITIVPNTPPSTVTISCPQNQNVIATTGATSAVVTFGGPTASTTCASGSNITITQISGPASGSTFPVGTTQVCFLATDACGSTASCCFNVTVVGSTVNPPGSTVSISCPTNITMNVPAGSTGMVVNYPTPTASTICTQTGTLNVVQISGLPSGSFFPVGTSTVCYSATDACGSVVSCCFNITITGGNPPGNAITITVPPNVTINCGQTANLPLANASTTCPAGGVNVTWVDATVGTSCTGITYTRTYTATDACGNQATAVYTITQLPDTTPPTWTSLPPQDQMINCGDPINYGTATASDCSAPVNITFTVTNNGATSCNTVNGITYGYDLYVHWVATDLCGNVATANTNIWVLPSTNIAFLSKPADKEMACSDDMVWEQPMPKSFIADIVHIDYEDDYNLDACGAGTVTRTWTATDAVGNTCQAQQIITILPDLEKPTISLPYSYTTVDCNGNLPNVQPTVADNCTYIDDLIVTTVDQQWGQTIERTFIVTDACGNVNAAVLTIGLNDNLAPVFQALPAPKTIACGAPVDFEQAVATDACQVNSLTYTDQVQITACAETHTRTWTAVDANGNSSQAQQVITVTDQDAPAFAIDPQDKTVACADDILFDQPTAIDACGTVSIYFNDVQTTPSCGASGYAVTRTWTANDGCNNLTQIDQVIAVAEDHAAPVIHTTFPAVTEVTLAQSQNWQAPVLDVSDNCNTVSVSHQLSMIDNCNFTVTYAATDACGNLSTVTQMVRIVDGPCVVLGIEDFDGNLTLDVYPNPTGGQLTLDLKGELAPEYECVIFDVFGRQVLRQSITQAKTALQLDTLADGAYWLSLTDGQNNAVVKFVKAAK